MEKKAKKAKSKTKSKVANASSKLTAKQEQFCRIYIDILNATEAYARAYYPEDPSKANRETCCSNASKTLRLAKVRAYIDYLKAQRAEELQVDSSWALKKALENYEMAKKGTPIVRFNKETHKFEETGTFETNVRDANDALRLIVDLCGFTEKKVSIEGSLATSTIVQEDV